jgi:hypothetical protein
MLLPRSNYKLRELLEREFVKDIEQLVDFSSTPVGSTTCSSSLVVTLLRFTSKANRPKLAMSWFPKYDLVQSLFVRIKDFETDCHNFLNCFNHGLRNNQLVITLPALTCQMGQQQMFKPSDNKYRQFWVAFNLRPGSISIFHVKEEQSCGTCSPSPRTWPALPPSILKLAPQSLLLPSPPPKQSSSSLLTPSCLSW